jgi:hypothetical protein
MSPAFRSRRSTASFTNSTPREVPCGTYRKGVARLDHVDHAGNSVERGSSPPPGRRDLRLHGVRGRVTRLRRVRSWSECGANADQDGATTPRERDLPHIHTEDPSPSGRGDHHALCNGALGLAPALARAAAGATQTATRLCGSLSKDACGRSSNPAACPGVGCGAESW